MDCSPAPPTSRAVVLQLLEKRWDAVRSGDECACRKVDTALASTVFDGLLGAVGCKVPSAACDALVSLGSALGTVPQTALHLFHELHVPAGLRHLVLSPPPDASCTADTAAGGPVLKKSRTEHGRDMFSADHGVMEAHGAASDVPSLESSVNASTAVEGAHEGAQRPELDPAGTGKAAFVTKAGVASRRPTRNSALQKWRQNVTLLLDTFSADQVVPAQWPSSTPDAVLRHPFRVPPKA